MKVLVTGHKGYLGSHFVESYHRDFDIVGYDRKEGDELLDYNNLLKKIQGCEQVIHLAAIPKPVEGKTFTEYMDNNVRGTEYVLHAAVESHVKRIVYASSTTIYGIEKGIPFNIPIQENQPIISQYISAEKLHCRDIDLSYHVSKVMAEQELAWYGLNKKIEAIALRFGPIDKVFLGTSVSMENALQAIYLAMISKREFWYEAFSIVDDISHINIEKARRLLGYVPKMTQYKKEQIHSVLQDKAE